MRSSLIGLGLTILVALGGYLGYAYYKSSKAVDLFNRGLEQAREGNYVEAIEVYTQVIELLPTYARAYQQRALTHMARAENTFERTLQRTWDGSRFTEGYVRVNNEQEYKLAASDFQKFIALDSKRADAYYSLGLVETRLGNLDEAIQSHNKAIELDPTQYLPYAGLAVAYENKSDYGTAIQMWNQALQLASGKDIMLHFSLGGTFEKAQRYGEAIQEYQKFVELVERSGKYNKDSLEKLKEKIKGLRKDR
jgi:tetratricopeptide (TPR) repeat protein